MMNRFKHIYGLIAATVFFWVSAAGATAQHVGATAFPEGKPAADFVADNTSTTIDNIAIPTYSLKTYQLLKESHPQLAKDFLQTFANIGPANAYTQKELAYQLLDKKQSVQALAHLEMAEHLDPHDYAIKMEIAYIYDDIDQDNRAFHKYAEVSQASDPKLALTAKQSMVDIGGVQTQILPAPYFSDFYFSPYYLFRWDDAIFPAIFRIGRSFGADQQLQIYGIGYYNQDSQTVIDSDIVADNSTAVDIGARWVPFIKIPAYLYVETGEDYNMIASDETGDRRWTSDLRGGIDSSTAWGEAPHYADTLRFPIKHAGDVYADFSYFSHYSYDWIGQMILHEGIRLLEYKHTSVDLYGKLNYVFDTKQFFYNNLVESGVGLAVIPYNLLNIRLRFELAEGYYIKVDSPDPNPYGKTYNASLVMLEAYFTF